LGSILGCFALDLNCVGLTASSYQCKGGSGEAQATSKKERDTSPKVAMKRDPP